MRISRVACINDMSGFGRCSLTTAIPILSAASLQPCPVPTAVLSKHTGFENFYFKDLTESLEPYMKNWDDLSFDGIYSGFLGSAVQIHAVEEFIKKHKTKDKSKIIIDPVMGDNGKLYPTYTEQMRINMKNLVRQADIITPNITEACFLTGTDYKGEEIDDSFAEELIKKLGDMTNGKIALTGIVRNEKIINFTYENGEIRQSEIKRETRVFSGAGDIFSAVVCALNFRDFSFYESVYIAGLFVSASIEKTISLDAPLSEGIVFEPVLRRICELTTGI